MRHNENLTKNYALPVPWRQRALPKAYFKGLAFTTAFLLRYFGLNKTASAEEQQLAANHVVLSHAIFKSCSLHPKDECGQAALIFEELCQYSPMAIDSQRVEPGDRLNVSRLLHTIHFASKRGRNDTTSNIEPLVSPSAQPVSTDPSVVSPDAFGMSMNPSLDPWAGDMLFSGQDWGGHDWDAFNLPFMETQFPPSQYNQ
jgi:hypothetical protein